MSSLLGVCGAGGGPSNYALVSLNGRRWDIHQSGVAVHVPNDRKSVLRVCAMGDVVSRCFGAVENEDGPPPATRTPGCEVLADDCTCFRWMYSRELTNTPSQVKVAVSMRRPSCALVTYTPSLSSGGGSRPQRLTTVDLVYELDHFRPVVPHGYVWQLEQQYARMIQTTNATQKSKPFFKYFHENKEAFCDKKSLVKRALPVSYSCERKHLLPIYATSFGEARKASPSYLEPLLFGLHLVLLLAVWAQSKRKLHEQ